MFFILHSFINLFAGGRSSIKVSLFFIYAAVLVGLFLYFRKKKLPSIKGIWPACTIAALYIYGLLLHLWYVHQLSLPLRSYLVTSHGLELSSTTLTHTHVAKGIIGWVASSFGMTNFIAMDAGGAYIASFPWYVFAFGAVILIASIVLTVWYFLTTFKQYFTSNRKSIVLTILYTIASFSIIKTAIDGGVFSIELLAVIVALVIFFSKKQWVYHALPLLSIVLLSFALWINTLSYDAGMGIAHIAALFLLYGVLLLLSRDTLRAQTILPLCILFILAWWVTGSRDMRVREYTLVPIAQGEVYMRYDSKTQTVHKEIADEDTSIGKVVKAHGENATYVPVSVPWKTCNPTKTSSNTLLTLLTKRKIELLPSSPFVQIKVLSTTEHNNQWMQEVLLIATPCTPAPLSVLNTYLHTAGHENYVLLYSDESQEL